MLDWRTTGLRSISICPEAGLTPAGSLGPIDVAAYIYITLFGNIAYALTLSGWWDALIVFEHSALAVKGPDNDSDSQSSSIGGGDLGFLL